MAYTLVHSDDGSGSAGALGSEWTEEAFVASWTRNGSGVIVPGESYGTSVVYATDLSSADHAIEAVVVAGANSADHSLTIRGDSAASAYDQVRLVGQEVYYNGAYVAGYWGGYAANPTLRLEAEGTTYRFFVNGVQRWSGTPVRSGGTASNYVGMRSTSSFTWDSVSIYDWDSGGPSVPGPYWGVLAN